MVDLDVFRIWQGCVVWIDVVRETDYFNSEKSEFMRVSAHEYKESYKR